MDLSSAKCSAKVAIMQAQRRQVPLVLEDALKLGNATPFKKMAMPKYQF